MYAIPASPGRRHDVQVSVNALSSDALPEVPLDLGLPEGLRRRVRNDVDRVRGAEEPGEVPFWERRD